MKKRLIAFLLIVATLISVFTSCGAHEHSYTEEIIKETSCKEPGEMKLTCSCGDVVINSIPRAHQWSESYCGETQICLIEGCGQTRTNPGIHSLDYATKTCKNCSCPAIRVKLPEGATTVTLYNSKNEPITILKVSVTEFTSSADSITITWSAEKISNGSGLNGALTATVISYKLVDSDGYVVHSGSDSSAAIAVGDKVRNLTFSIPKLTLWESYRFQFCDVFN